MLEYVLTACPYGTKPSVAISADKFTHIKHSKERLLEYLFVEEKFDLISENYFELETEVFNSAIRWVPEYGENRYVSFMHDKACLNRRLINLLGVGRAYTDQVKGHIKHIAAKGTSENEAIHAELRKQYDEKFGYRFIEALRNYTQHRTFPIIDIAYGVRSLSDGGVSLAQSKVTLDPTIEISQLLEDPKFKRSIFSDADRGVERHINLKQVVREYIEGVWAVHQKVRAQFDFCHDEWEAELKGAVELYKSRTGFDDFQETSPVFAISRYEEREHQEEFNINLLKLIKYRQYLISKNYSFKGLSSAHVSLECK